MAALPYMKLFVADYLADTRHLTAAQHGAYLLLIFNYWQTGKPLPNDDAKLARIASMTKRDWARNRDAILEFFSVQENLLVHSRIAQELSRVEAKSLNNKRPGNANAKRTRRDGDANATRTPIYTDTDTDTDIPLGKPNGASDTEFWDSAKSYLRSESKNPGALIGKWCRDYGKPETAQAITAAQLERPVGRIPFIEGTLRKRGRVKPAVPI
jgi:uncharacterized protein YdaU (DUF1376 family)